MQNTNNKSQFLDFREAMLYPFELPEAFYAIRRDCVEAFTPTNSYEMHLVEQIADNQFRLNRAHQLECAHVDILIERDQNTQKYEGIHQLANALENSLKTSPFFEIIRRYRAQAERAIRRAQSTLLEYRTAQLQPGPETTQPKLSPEPTSIEITLENPECLSPTPTGSLSSWNWARISKTKNYETKSADFAEALAAEKVPREQAFSA